MKTSLLILALSSISLAAPTLAQDEPAKLDSSRVALRGAALRAFVPSGWRLEKQIFGDLNRDQRPDAALVLVENKRAKNADGDPTDRARALVVALKSGKSWRRAGVNNSLLLSTRGGGAFWGVVETPVEVSIRKGVLLVKQSSGSREVVDTTHRFRLDKRLNRFFLIGADWNEIDRATASSTQFSANYLTGISKTSRSKAESDDITRTTGRVSTRLKRFEVVTGGEVWR